MKEIIKVLIFLFMLFIGISLGAQVKTTEMADMMRSSGRIYVVVAVMLSILAGLLLYIIRIDRKLSRMEKEKKH